MQSLRTVVTVSVALILGVPGVAFPAVYSIGEPTDDEQYLLELINRARNDANAEAFRLMTTTDPDVLAAYASCTVDLKVMTNQFSWLGLYLPPLAMNARLLTSARLHSQDMYLNRFQSHFSSTNPPAPNQSGDSPATRMGRQGYPVKYSSENIYAHGQSVFYTHAAFEVDWGGPATNGGMQSPPSHRHTIFSHDYSEVGIGVVTGSPAGFGPYFATQDFGTGSNHCPFITGAAYYDLNGNGLCDPGEGIGGLNVTVAGWPTSGVTAVSGGYAVPVPSNGAYNVTFSGQGFVPVTNLVGVYSDRNTRLDFLPAYAPPSLSGPSTATSGSTNLYAVQALTGATNHDVRAFLLSTNNWSEGAETGTNYVTLETDPRYSSFSSVFRSSGSYSFHLTHSAARDQSLTLSRSIYVASAGATLQFKSRLGWATTNQFAAVLLSSDGGSTWVNGYTQRGAGEGLSGETSFTLRSLSLAAHTNRILAIRFLYDVRVGSCYAATNDACGWCIDDISAPGTREALPATTTSLGSYANVAWVPAVSGEYLLQVRGTYGRRQFPYHSSVLVTAADLRFAVNAVDQPASDQRLFRVRVTSGTPSTLGLEYADSLTGSFTSAVATLSGPTNGEYRLLHTLPTNVTTRFFRVWGR